MKPIIIIPAYKPDTALLKLVKDLTLAQCSLIVVNDGSGTAFLSIFDALAQSDQVTVLHHENNQGKGQALKTAFAHFLAHCPDTSMGVVTADADGQHLPEDIIGVCQQLQNDPQALWLGSRSFEKNVPWRSRFGNLLTRSIFKMLVGQSLQDTQTGLRGIPRAFLHTLLKRPSAGYDFELDMLLCSFAQKYPIKQHGIQTVYKEANKSSHFNPLVDSFKIYWVMLRYLVR
jgi:glycosyltransferase involved in cell wall biosynthesis